ncbi:MAG: manganese-binding transcriptional regulator MntR [Deltaproteobacteria bacterium]|nr:manganese-binding transcriptional regulator MntR [Deltaproteobacteria bacterium]
MTVKNVKFKRLRDAHTRETAEDYVEMIQELVTEQGEARLTDLAHRFGVTSVTVHKILARLQRENLIQSQPYRAIFLTDKGKKMALQSRKRHEIVYQFLRSLGVSEKIAHIDAEGIEHHVSSETLRLFEKFTPHSTKKKP